MRVEECEIIFFMNNDYIFYYSLTEKEKLMREVLK